MSHIYIELLNSLDKVVPILQDLSANTPYTVHQHPGWYQAYIDAFNPHVICLAVRSRQNGTPLGLLPLQLEEFRGTRFWNLRRLVPLAHGPSDFVNLLVEPSKEEVFANAVAEWLGHNHQAWESLFLPYIPASSPAWQPLVRALEARGLQPEVDISHGFWEVDTSGDWDVYFANFIRKHNQDLLKDIRRLHREGRYPHVISVRKGIVQYLPQLLPLYRQRRKTLGQGFKYEDPRQLQFLTQAICTFETEGAVELSLLVGGDGSIWAYQLDWLDKGVRYHWMHAYNERLSKYSPGKLLLYELLQKSFYNPAIRRCNFMRGEAGYKKKLANMRQEYVYIKAVNPRSLRAHVTRVASWAVRMKNSIWPRKWMVV